MIRMFTASFVLAVVTTLVAATNSPQVMPGLPGDQSRWSLDFGASLEQPSSPPLEVHLGGAWVSTISTVRKGEFDAQLQLADLRFSGDALKNATPASLAALENRLARPFWATYRSDGGLIAIHFFRDVTPSDRNLLQMIATEMQLVRPDSPRESRPKSWTAQERDGAGEYAALYLAPQPDHILKRKLKYLYTDGLAGGPSNTIRVSIDQSDIAFSISADHQVQAVDGKNRMRVSLSPDNSQRLVAATEFHASHLQTAHKPQLIGSLGRAHPDVVDFPISTQRIDANTARADADDRLLSGYSTDAILEAAFMKDPKATAQPDLLNALFRHDPQAPEKATALLIQNGPRKLVTNALGSATSLSAITALSQLAYNPALPESLRVDAILAFVQMQHPMAEAMHVSASLISDSNLAVRSAARLISGALARAGRSAHPVEADAIDASVLALYRRADDTHEKAELLSALGNSASPAAIHSIKEALSDSSATIRAAAARALRLGAGSDIDQLLATVILNDQNANVRSDAIFATRFRHPLPSQLANALLQAATNDQTTYVRSGALAVIRQNLKASVDIPETLKRIATSDSDSNIRRQASDGLDALSNGASTQP